MVPNASTASLPFLNVSSSWISTSATPLAPSFAKDLAVALPIPLAPPVMKATPGVKLEDRREDISWEYRFHDEISSRLTSAGSFEHGMKRIDVSVPR